MERDERTIVTADEVKRAVYPAQLQRFLRGAVHTPTAFSLCNVIYLRHQCTLNFVMTGETSPYDIWFGEDECPTTTRVNCNCPDPYPGLCKHICWLVFKVLKHDDLGVFTTHRFPKEHLGILIEEVGARALLVETWGRSGTHGRASPLAVPTSWPPADVDCAICFDGMVEQTKARQCQNCSNCFHAACIDRWFVQRRSCPLCRHVF